MWCRIIDIGLNADSLQTTSRLVPRLPGPREVNGVASRCWVWCHAGMAVAVFQTQHVQWGRVSRFTHAPRRICCTRTWRDTIGIAKGTTGVILFGRQLTLASSTTLSDVTGDEQSSTSKRFSTSSLFFLLHFINHNGVIHL